MADIIRELEKEQLRTDLPKLKWAIPSAYS